MAKNGTDEVEEMLRAAEDDLLLKLARNSHTTHKQKSPITSLSPLNSSPSSSTFIKSDLARRFDALKSSNTKSTGNTSSPSSYSSSEVDLTDDLVARFEALKTAGKSAPPPPAVRTHPVVSATDRISDENRSSKEEDEVEEVMRWAMDTARLHPEDKTGSTSTSEEDDDDDDEEEDEEEVEERKKKNDGRSKAVEKKGKRKDGKKWFFF